MSNIPKPVRRVSSRPARLLSRLLSLRSPQDHQPAQDGSIDVWQWTRSKYRLRSLLLLMVNALLFAGLGCFTLWLRTGQYFVHGSFEQYWQAWWAAFDPTREQQLTLIDYLIYPIPADQVPLMMVIMGLVLASLTAVPILVSMLYRFPFSLIFTFIIGFVAMLPWLAITVTVCCFLARWRPLRFSFHYATVLVSLLPVLLYYALATRNAEASLVLTPVELAKLYLPWVLAIVAACILMGIALTLAWLVNYRPGAIAPLLAVMFVTPVALFEAQVGRDELYYRVLESRYGPDSKTCFVNNVKVSSIIKRRLVEDPAGFDVLDMDSDIAPDQAESQWQLRVVSEVFTLQQYEAVEALDHFRKTFPESRYIPNVLYLKGRSIDMRIDQNAFAEQGVLRYYSDFPNAASRAVWEELHDQFVDSPLWLPATLRLAMLAGRVERTSQTLDLLEELMARCAGQKESNNQSPGVTGWRVLLTKRSPSDKLAVDQGAVHLAGWKLRDLIAANRQGEPGDQAIQRLLTFDPRHAMFRRNLEHLKGEIPTRYPDSPLADNLDVLIAASQRSRSRKIEELRATVGRLLEMTDSDALPQARYELALAYQQDNRQAEARAGFEEVVRLHPDTAWAVEARSRLAGMGMAARLAD